MRLILMRVPQKLSFRISESVFSEGSLLADWEKELLCKVRSRESCLRAWSRTLLERRVPRRLPLRPRRMGRAMEPAVRAAVGALGAVLVRRRVRVLCRCGPAELPEFSLAATRLDRMLF